MRLESDQIIDVSRRIVAAKLHHGIGLFPCSGIAQADGLHRAVAQCIHSAARHDLHGHAALEDTTVLKAMNLGLLR